MAKRDATRANRDMIKGVAAVMFSERSYNATTLREIARAGGMTLGTIYHYFPSKEDLLVELIDDAMAPLMETVKEVDVRIQTEPPEDVLAWMVRTFVLGTLERLDTAIISDIELRALSPKNLKEAVSQRDAYQAAMERVVERGIEDGAFSVDDVKLTVFAIVSACNGVPRWYRPEGRASPTAIANLHVELALRMVGAARERARATSRQKTRPK